MSNPINERISPADIDAESVRVLPDYPYDDDDDDEGDGDFDDDDAPSISGERWFSRPGFGSPDWWSQA